MDWSIPGASDIAPWVGELKGPAAVAEFYRDFRSYLQSQKFNIKSLMADYECSVALGLLQCQVVRIAKTITTDYAIEFEVINDLITRYRFFENSYGVAGAAQ